MVCGVPGVAGAVVPGVGGALLVVELHPGDQVEEPGGEVQGG